eukprot:CAMPEP_0194752476 /NCGR_PEP_ID=MMETSP0323_2-20130528/6272_1 /TAXON_ID=2866 ORGANISM="Crypthecodinium cohnii, Strain Seligo" /NCGR_SAMPLE_ID=MMETSP0323_2 /ASSEMBLY_ACC=CAM_ASM_000346 /LENGTH=70 /DNA_ID=CAMNT_0039669437 /DNA_START=427 /DNA_END=639 /DNA_ORIENTATION=-
MARAVAESQGKIVFEGEMGMRLETSRARQTSGSKLTGPHKLNKMREHQKRRRDELEMGCCNSRSTTRGSC